MKKLLLVLLVVTLASFLFVGCLPTTPAEGEGEGEGEGEVGVTVEIADSVVVDGKTYVSGGNHDITVTFPTPVVGGVGAYITDCGGDYSKVEINGTPDCGSEVVLFPNADRTIWTGSAEFGPCGGGCCASYVQVESGECEAEACIWFPVIVDSEDPYATVEICIDKCTCAGCELSFTSTTSEVTCDDDTVNCGDACSGLASWSVVLYDGDPFDECCDPNVCEEPIGSCSGTACPIVCETECLVEGTYYAVVTLADNVGNETKMVTTIVFNPDTCDAISLTPWQADDCVDTPNFVLCEEMVSALGNINGTVRDALTTIGIPGAIVAILNTSIPSTITDGSGNYSFSDVPVGDYDVEASATGYVDNTVSLTVQENQTVTGDIVLTPTLASGEMRIILTWGTTDDFDSHLWNPGGQHLFWINDTITGANLDVDDMDGFGPETVTITALSNGTYTYAVYAWSLAGTFSDSSAVVRLYDSTGLLNTFTIPSGSGTDRWWEVFTLSVSGGSVTVNTINTFSSSSPL